MILRDPVHGLIAFEGDAEVVVNTLLATAEVQRLRRIRQLGLAHLVFPGAEHTRFAHALGTAFVMQRFLGRARELEHLLPAEERLDADAIREAIAAAMLHDLGHGPFSHLFEELQPGAVHHEEWTSKILLEDTEIHRALEGLSQGMSGRVADLLRGKHRIGYLTRAVSGTLDVDRSDYLLRDSHMTGVRYGLFDLDWLLRALTFAKVGSDWVLAVEGRKGLPPIEGFFLARHFMYQQVYHHKATRSAEALIRAMFLRLGELVRNGDSLAVPDAIAKASRAEVVDVHDYLALDDAVIQAAFSQWSDSRDPELADLARRVRNRVLPKSLPLPAELGQHGWAVALERVQEVASAHGARPELHVRLDVASDTPYEEPDDSLGARAEGLWIVIRHRPVERLSVQSFLLAQLRGKTLQTPRLIFPEEWREDVARSLAALTAS